MASCLRALTRASQCRRRAGSHCDRRTPWSMDPQRAAEPGLSPTRALCDRWNLRLVREAVGDEAPHECPPGLTMVPPPSATRGSEWPVVASRVELLDLEPEPLPDGVADSHHRVEVRRAHPLHSRKVEADSRLGRETGEREPFQRHDPPDQVERLGLGGASGHRGIHDALRAVGPDQDLLGDPFAARGRRQLSCLVVRGDRDHLASDLGDHVSDVVARDLPRWPTCPTPTPFLCRT
jgi:hypothetical protein